MRGSRLVCLLSVALLAGCLKPTEVTLEITTDTCNDPADGGQVYSGTNITAVAEQALSPTTPASLFPPSAQTSNCSGTNIGTLVVVPGPSGNGPLLITVATGLSADPDICAHPEDAGAKCIIETREITLVDNTPLYLPIDMRKSCAGIYCQEIPNTTCINGKCVSNQVPPCDPNGVCSSLDGDGGPLDGGTGADARFPVDAPRHDAGHDATMKDAGDPGDGGKHDATLSDAGADTGRDAPPPCTGQVMPSGACLETLATSEMYPWAIAVQGGHVYWTTECTTEGGACYDGGSVRMASGGAATDLEPGQNAATGIATTDAAVFWTTQGGCTGTPLMPDCTGAVAMASLTGGDATIISAPNSPKPWAIAAAGGTVCWVDHGNDLGGGEAGVTGSAWCKVGGAMPVKVSGGIPQAYSGGVAVDQSNVYWTNFGFNGLGNGLAGTVVRASTLGGSVVTLETGQNYVINVAASDGGVFWMNLTFDDGGGTSYGSVYGAAADASDTRVVNAGFGLAFNLAVDDKYVYWAASAEGKVFKIGRSGSGEPTMLASGQNTPSNVVLDDTNGIYWTNNGTCTGSGQCTGSVMKLAPR